MINLWRDKYDRLWPEVVQLTYLQKCSNVAGDWSWGLSIVNFSIGWILIAVVLCAGQSTVSAQTAPIGRAKPGDVLRPGHLGRQTGDLERIIHFNHELLGTDIQGERDVPRNFFATPGLTGAGVPVVRAGGTPLEVPLMYGSGMRKRALIVRGPDGYPVEPVELMPAPATNAPDDSNIIGARSSLTVSDLEATKNLYRELVGPELEFWTSPDFVGDNAYNRLRTTPGAEYRFAAALIPGSTVPLELIQYRSIEQYSIAPAIQDIGVGHVLFMVEDMDLFMSRIRAAGLETLATSGEPVFIGPTAPAMFVTDNDNFFVEFIGRLPG